MMAFRTPVAPADHTRPSSSSSFRRAATFPTRLQPQNGDRSDVPRGSAETETLYEHPRVMVARFSPASSSGSSGSNSWAAMNSAPGTLPWASRSEKIVAAGKMSLYRLLAHPKITYLLSGSLFLTFMPRSQCWCVDGQSKFALWSKGLAYRIELPFETNEDKHRVEQLKELLTEVMLFEKTACPFDRNFTIELINEIDLSTPMKVARLGSHLYTPKEESEKSPMLVQTPAGTEELFDSPLVSTSAAQLDEENSLSSAAPNAKIPQSEPLTDQLRDHTPTGSPQPAKLPARLRQEVLPLQIEQSSRSITAPVDLPAFSAKDMASLRSHVITSKQPLPADIISLREASPNEVPSKFQFISNDQKSVLPTTPDGANVREHVLNEPTPPTAPEESVALSVPAEAPQDALPSELDPRDEVSVSTEDLVQPTDTPVQEMPKEPDSSSHVPSAEQAQMPTQLSSSPEDTEPTSADALPTEEESPEETPPVQNSAIDHLRAGHETLHETPLPEVLVQKAADVISEHGSSEEQEDMHDETMSSAAVAQPSIQEPSQERSRDSSPDGSYRDARSFASSTQSFMTAQTSSSEVALPLTPPSLPSIDPESPTTPQDAVAARKSRKDLDSSTFSTLAPIQALSVKDRQTLRRQRSRTPDYLRDDSPLPVTPYKAGGLVSQTVGLLLGPPSGLVQIMMQIANRIASGRTTGPTGAYRLNERKIRLPGKWLDSDDEGGDDSGDEGQPAVWEDTEDDFGVPLR